MAGGAQPPGFSSATQAAVRWQPVSREAFGNKLVGQVMDTTLPPQAEWEANFNYPDVLQQFQLSQQPGQTVVEVGSGYGTLCQLMAETYPNSQVVGLDIDPIQVALLKQRASNKGLQNVSVAQVNAFALPTPQQRLQSWLATQQVRLGRLLRTVLPWKKPLAEDARPILTGQLNGIPLPSNAAHTIVLCNIFHGTSTQKRNVLAEAYRVLKPGGRVVLINWERNSENPHAPMLGARPTPHMIRKDAELMGFVTQTAHKSLSADLFLTTLQKPGGSLR